MTPENQIEDMKKLLTLALTLSVAVFAMAAGNGILKKASYNKYDGTELIQFLLGTGNVDPADLSFTKNETIGMYQNWVAARFPGEDFRTVVAGSVEEDTQGFDFAASNMGFVTADKKIEWFRRQPYSGERVLVYKGIVWASTWCWNPMDAQKRPSNLTIAPRRTQPRPQPQPEYDENTNPETYRSNSPSRDPNVVYVNNPNPAPAPAPEKKNGIGNVLLAIAAGAAGGFIENRLEDGYNHLRYSNQGMSSYYYSNNQAISTNYNYSNSGGNVFPRYDFPRPGFGGGYSNTWPPNGGGNLYEFTRPGFGDGYSNTWPPNGGGNSGGNVFPRYDFPRPGFGGGYPNTWPPNGGGNGGGNTWPPNGGGNGGGNYIGRPIHIGG